MIGVRKLIVIVIQIGIEATKTEMDMNSDRDGYTDS